MAKPVVIPAARAKLVQVFGGDIYLTMPSDEAGAGLSVFEDVRGPGGGPPLHVHHNEDEVFRVIEGRYRARVGEETLEAGPGDTLLLPRGVSHTFVTTGEGLDRVLVILQPGGFERFCLEVAEQGLQVPDDMARIVELAARYKLEFLGPNPFTGR